MASNRNGDEVPDLTSKKARTDIMESNQNNENVDLYNSIEIEVTQDVSNDDDVQIGKIITDNPRKIMNELSGIKETLKDVINDEKDKKAGEILSTNKDTETIFLYNYNCAKNSCSCQIWLSQYFLHFALCKIIS